MRKFLTPGFFALLMLFLPYSANAQDGLKEKIVAPQVMVVKFYADWCGSCKAMQPELDKFLDATKNKSVLYVHLDLTDEQKRQKSAYLAYSLGLEEIYKEHAAKTGFALLVDVSSTSIKGKITKDMSSSDMYAMLESAY